MNLTSPNRLHKLRGNKCGSWSNDATPVSRQEAVILEDKQVSGLKTKKLKPVAKIMYRISGNHLFEFEKEHLWSCYGKYEKMRDGTKAMERLRSGGGHLNRWNVKFKLVDVNTGDVLDSYATPLRKG